MCGARRGPRQADRLDGRRGRRAGAGQRRGLFVSPVRPGRAGARAADRGAVRVAAGRPALCDIAGHRGRADGGGGAHRRKCLSRRPSADDVDAGARRRLPLVGARPFLVLGRAGGRPGGLRGDLQRSRATGVGADMAAGTAGRCRGGGAAGAGAPARYGLAGRARGPGRLVRCHRRGLRGGQVCRGRAGRSGAGRHLRRLVWSRWSSLSHWAPASRGRWPPTGPTRPASSRSCGRWSAHGTGHLLVEDPSVARYYLPAGRQWQRWSSTRNIVLPSGSQHRWPGQHGKCGRCRQCRVSSRSSSPAATSPTSR